MIERAIRSMRQRIAEHETWIADPYLKLHRDEDPRRVRALVENKWPRDISRIREEIEVLSGLLQERRT